MTESNYKEIISINSNDNKTAESEINISNLKESRRTVIKNNYWNEEHEEILKNLKTYTNFLTREYQQAYWKYRSRLQIYRIPIIIMSSLSGFLSISNSGYIPPEYNKWASLLVGFVNLMVTVITLIENFKKIDTNMNKSFSAHINFKRLHDEIAIMLKVPPAERVDNGNDTISTFFSRYQSYLQEAPVIKKISNNLLECPLESKIVQDFQEKAKTSSSIKSLIKNNTVINSSEIEDLNSVSIINKLKSANPIPSNIKKTNSTNDLENTNDIEMQKNTKLKSIVNKVQTINKIKNLSKESIKKSSENLVDNLNNSEIINMEFMDSENAGEKPKNNIKINEDV
jgi:hypothetical protein